MARILLLQLKRIGDAVLTAPALGALRAADPSAEIMLVLAGAAGSLAPLFAEADEVLTWKSGSWNAALLHRLREWRPDMVLDYTGTDRSAFLSLVSGAPVRAGYAKTTLRGLRRFSCTVTCSASVRENHTIDFHHALAHAAGLILPTVGDAGHLKIPHQANTFPLPARYIAIHPGTAREEKFWPPGHWAALLDHLHDTHGLPILLTGGDWSFEQEQIARISSLTQAPVRNLRGTLTLPGLARVIAGAALAVTVDTAAMHLAASFRVPQVALFGPTNPFHWAPRHDRAVVLQAGIPAGSALVPKRTGRPISELDWQTVAAAADGLLTAEQVVPAGAGQGAASAKASP
ncbi:MAG: rfaQ [Verrucomicrobiales bacterium]|nr:rfaQ [Verrucomicrobiales bacterium]